MFFTNTGAITNPVNNVSEDEATLESMQMINEAAISAFLTEDEQVELLESHSEVASLINNDIVTEKTLVRLDKKARINQVQKMSVFTIAKEKNDPIFRKLLTVWRIERNLEKKLFDKYGSEGMRRAKSTVQKNFRQKGTAFVKINDRSAKAINRVAKGTAAKSTLKK